MLMPCIITRLFSTITSFGKAPLLLIFFVATLNAVAPTHSWASTGEYFPLFLQDGDKYVVTVKTTQKTAGQDPIASAFTEYYLVNGSEIISGVQCKKTFASSKDFQSSLVAGTSVAYSALIGDTLRTYQSETATSDDKFVLTCKCSPYVGSPLDMEIGNSYSVQYTQSCDDQYGDPEYHIVNTVNENIKVLGYEDIVTSFGSFNSCLKMVWTTSQATSDSQPITTATTTVWYAKNIGLVKTYLKDDYGDEITAEYKYTYYATPTYYSTSPAATSLAVSAPSLVSSGTAFSFTVAAQDSSNNSVQGYASKVHFTSTDPAATLPEDAILTNGTGTFTAVLKTAGQQTITVTDAVSASVAGTSGIITVLTRPTFTVTPSAGAHGSISPNSPQQIASGTTTSFTISPDVGYYASVTGCGGTLSGQTYTTRPITYDCTVSATFTDTNLAKYKISGTVKNAVGLPMANVLLTLNGSATTTTRTDSYGNYKFKFLADGMYTITPSKTGKIFTPANRTVTISNATVTGAKFIGKKQ